MYLKIIPMKLNTFTPFTLLVLFVMFSNFAISQKYSSVESYTLRTNLKNITSVDLKFFRCEIDSDYLLQVRTSDNKSNEIDCSSKSTVFYLKMNKDDFRERIKKMLVKGKLLGDNTEDLMDKLFNDAKGLFQI